MAIDLIIALFSILVFFTLGTLFTQKIRIGSILERVIFSILVGIAQCILLATLFVKIGLPVDYLIITLILILILSISKIAKEIKIKAHLKLISICKT
jgi:hypothetical protein